MQSRLFAFRYVGVIGSAFAIVAGSVAPAGAYQVLTSDDAAATALASGFARVAKAEATPSIRRAWDVWATKDGIAYVVTIDASTGKVLAAMPAVADD